MAAAKKLAKKVGKKAPKKPAAPQRTATRTKPRPKLSAQDKLAARGIDWVCGRIVEKVTLTTIAKEAHVSVGSLITWLDGDAERSARAREARIHVAKLYDEQALEGLEKARTPFQLAKAKEAAHHLRWRASKIAPREYGEKIAVGGAGDLPPILTAAAMTDEQLAAIAAGRRAAVA